MKKKILFLIITFLAWLPVFAIQKPLFMLYNHSLAAGSSITDYLNVIWYGLKLDMTVAGYLTIIPLIITIISIYFPSRIYRKILNLYFLIISIAVSLIFAVDMALYQYWGFRLDSTLFFYMQSPKDAMASVPVGQGLFQVLVFILYGGGVWWCLRKFISPLFPDQCVKHKIATTIMILFLGALMFIPIRGGITTSTANVGMVYFSEKQFLNHSAINPCFSLLSSINKQQDFASQFNFFSEEERSEIFDSIKPTECDSVERVLTSNRPNILIILMESFSANVVEAVGGEAGITPNLNRLSKEGVLFTNMYANSFRTDRGIVAVLNGYPAQPTTSIMKYPSKSQTLPSIAKSLTQEGYSADMIYGGDINFTNMQSYFFGSGYSKITADRNFPLSKRLSKWGANDDVTFEHLYDDIATRPLDKPWLTTFLTLSSHEPFEVPYHRLEEPYTNSIAFTDSCLGSFIDKFKQLPAWKNTLIILIADHGFHYPHNLTECEPRRYHIPMIWTGGAVKDPMIVDKYAGQTDLAATLLSQLGLSHRDFSFSKDIFCPSSPQYAFYTFPNSFGFIDSTGVTVMDNESCQLLISDSSENEKQRLSKGKTLLQTLYDDLGNR